MCASGSLAARGLAAGLLVAVAALLALPLPAQAQKTTFVSNTGQSTDPDVREVGPHGHLWQLQAQQFRTGDNEGGYTLSAIQVRVDDFGSNSRPKVSIYTTSSGNPGTSLYVLTNPATLNDDAINTFRAPANATLEKDTNYFVVFEELGSGSNLRYDLEVTTSNAEDSGKASGWNITNSSRQRSTTITTWSDLAGKLKIAVRGTLPPALSIGDASAAENADHLLFEVTLSRAFQNTVKVDFETISGGTATEGVDYHARRTYTHVILAGDKTAQMGFALIEDTVDDAGETVMVRLSNARVVDAYGDKIKDLDITTDEATGTITAPPTTTTNVSNLNIRIQDATGDEDNGWLVFKVRLSRKYDEYVCYDFETISGGTATEGRDYLKFPKAGHWVQIGKRVDKPFVRIIDDSVNDNGETVKVKISNARLCDDASQTVSIMRAEATGTIRNTDPLPQAWLARFGRTVADQVLDAVDGRLRAARAAGMSVSLAGETIGGAAFNGMAADAGDTAQLEALSDWLTQETGDEDRSRGWSRTMTEREIVMGSSFSLVAQTDGGGFAALWGRMAQTSFAGREGTLSLDGDVTTGLLGADYASGRWTTGLVISNSIGEGGYRGESSGDIEATVTALTPWAGYAVTERLSVWGAAGYGTGELKLTAGDDPTLKTDLGMTLAAAGARGTLIGGNGPKLDAVTDGRWVRTTTAQVSSSPGNLASAEAEVTRLRLGLEGSWPLALGDEALGKGATVTPRLTLGVRHDGGDAETGFGADIGGGVTLAAPAQGLTISLEGRGLLTHEAAGFRDRGVAGSLAWDPPPSNGRGPKLTLTQTVGAGASGGKDALLSRTTLEGLAANDNGDALAQSRLELRAGYGFAMFDGGFTATPETGFGLSESASGSARDYSLGWRLTRAGSGAGSLEFSIEARRRESANDDVPPEHGIGFRLTARW